MPGELCLHWGTADMTLKCQISVGVGFPWNSNLRVKQDTEDERRRVGNSPQVTQVG